MKWYIIIIIFAYSILLLNRIWYLCINYYLEKNRLKEQERLELGGVRARHAIDRGQGRSSTLESNLQKKKDEYKYKFKKLWTKLIYDLINSFFTNITHLFRG